MHECTILRCLGCLLTLLSMLCAAVPGEARPQTPPTSSNSYVQIGAEQARRFDVALKSLSEQANVAFVVEGEPLVPLLSEEQVGKLVARRAHFSEFVEQIAVTFDYTVARHKNVIVLKKRYSDPNDLPGVTLEECRLAVQDVLRLLRPWKPRLINPDRGDQPMIEFADSLTDEQLQLMPREKGGLAVDSLNAQQRAVIWDVAFYFYVQIPEEKLRMIPAQIDLVLDEKTTFGWNQQKGMRLFGYEGTLAAPSGPYTYFRPLSHTGRVLTEASGLVGFMTRHDPTYRDPTDPGSEAKEGGKAESTATTLKAVVAALQARTAPPSKLEVDDALAAKPVTIVGSERAAPEAILRSLADVYGLRVRAEGDGTLRLTRRLPRPPKDIAGLPEALRKVFPEPLLRALRVDDIDQIRKEIDREQHRRAARNAALEAAERNGRAVDLSGEAERQRESFLRIDTHQKWRRTPVNQRIAAVRRLRALVEPKLNKAAAERVPSAALGEPERMALANVLMADCLETMRRLLSKDTPQHIRSFDSIILTGGMGTSPEGKSMFALSLDQPPHPNGVRVQGPGLAVEYRRK